MISIVPIAKTVCDWDTLLRLCQQTIHRNVAGSLDNKNIAGRDLPEFISMLGEFHDRESDAFKVQRDAGFLLKHASVSFLVFMAGAYDKGWLYSATDLKIVNCETENLFIITGTLEQWRSAILNLCSPAYMFSQYRYIGAGFVKALDDMGLSRLFEKYSRVEQKGQLILVEKK